MNKDQVTKKDIIRKIMGWVAEYPEREPGDHFCGAGDMWRYGLVKPRFPNGMTEEDFHPTFSIDHAYMVVNRMRERGHYMYRAEHPGDSFVTIYFTKPDDIKEVHTTEYCTATKVHYSEEPLGICMAALNALKEKD